MFASMFRSSNAIQRRFPLKIIALGLCACAGGFGYYSTRSAPLRIQPMSAKIVNDTQPLTASRPATATRKFAGSPNFIADVVSEISPAVVNITVKDILSSVGSGFFIDSTGVILTNHHVVNSVTRNARIVVTLHDGREVPAKLIASDKTSDLAILKVMSSQEVFPVIPWGSSDKCRPGEFVVAIGSSATLKNTVTAGIISAVARDPRELDMSPVPGRYTSYLQTDAAINGGNSGGPLVNMEGEVIGINCMRAMMFDGISFAIPVDIARVVVKHLLAKGYVPEPQLGLRVRTLTPALIAELRKTRMSLPPEVTEGCMIDDVTRSTPASEAGLKPDDVIVMVDGKPVPSLKDLIFVLSDVVGSTVPFVVWRGSQKLAIPVKVVERPH
eukprot:TRINITY_DN19166_c0_g1::TRINITY_DN19166_c0_g1_i1::g.2314::m.2314 TRINITY_DN19166_c0_g1::TRINITY_DN19166_c0_g1_i1::g.2314  ORF type:complete len:385 (+),score=44.13,sp/Q3E6S8/DGP14_ARATH/37.01/4e-63,Trypsin_2/PF13365.1/5.9e-23,PDZ_2/PF13180.1/1.5e+03,PDZ_2/PF13180.1/3e-14,Trypsin/PF00089.21/6.9e-13,Peptidase_S46/PF10459.4/0.14,Peptidase_S46/PF10459.4/0.001,PDZ/PF00595.19/1.9e+02,PDZ/PF00595.19/0.00023,LSM/PF01423.17/0.27 TRINITY_DN19166_c0_g1_i1:49-1203(+)